jgi:TonB family protein
MSFRALLFCADEKTSRAVTQVFRELEFHVEPSREPFDAVKRITGQHYDALVVDCDNEENATLLFKSARNSASNNNSLAVAVVEGQVNIAKAFRLGANLVLTKPINLEQAKGTLRVARGLLRKAETNKLNAGVPHQPVVEAETKSEVVRSSAPQKSVLTPLPVEAPAPAAATAPKIESKPQEEPADTLAKAALALSTAASSGQAAAVAPAKESKWASKPEALEPKPVVDGEVVKKPKKKEEPAAQVAKPAVAAAKSTTAPRFSSLGINAEDTSNDEQSKKNFWIAAIIVLLLGGAAYYGWTKYHPAIQLPFTQNEAPAPAPPAPPVPKPPAPEAAAIQPDATAVATPATTEAVTPAAPAATKAPLGLVNVSESTAEGLLIKKVDPNYPDQARDQKPDGLVQLRVNINKAGDVTSVKALHGNTLLVDAASTAVKQWKYKPYFVNGAPSEIETSVTLHFKQQ